MGKSFISFMELSEEIHSKYNDSLYSPDVELLYHYTDLNELLGILETNGFWATNYNYLNDKKEIIHGIEICEEIINELNVPDLSLEGKVYLESLRELLYSNDQDIFIVSFCSKPDLLSQWRGYGGGQQGVSIGLKYNEIINYSAPRDNEYFYIEKVIYDKKIQREILKDIIIRGLEINVQNKIMRDTFQQQAVNMTLKRFIALFKDDSFQEEFEWRKVTINFKDGSNKYETKFRVRDNYILPYVELPLKYQQSEWRNLPIKEMVVAPPSNSTSINSLEYMLDKKGYREVKVRSSIIPYR
jgi:hypothetical protein